MFSPILATSGGPAGEGTGSGVVVATGSAAGASLFTAAGAGITVATGSAVGASLFTGDGLASVVATGVAAGQAIITAIGNGISVVTGLGIGDWTYTLVLSAVQSIRLDAVCRLHGLIDPLTVNSTARGDGTVIQTLSGSGPVTVTTAGLPVSGPTLATLDKLARWYGLIDPMVEQDASRSDGILSQTVVTVGDTTTVTTI